MSAGTQILTLVMIIVILSGVIFKYESVAELNDEEWKLEHTEHPKDYQEQWNRTNQTRRESRNLNLLGDLPLYMGLFGVMVSYLNDIQGRVKLSELKLIYIMDNMNLKNNGVEEKPDSEEPDPQFRVQ